MILILLWNIWLLHSRPHWLEKLQVIRRRSCSPSANSQRPGAPDTPHPVLCSWVPPPRLSSKYSCSRSAGQGPCRVGCAAEPNLGEGSPASPRLASLACLDQYLCSNPLAQAWELKQNMTNKAFGGREGVLGAHFLLPSTALKHLKGNRDGGSPRWRISWVGRAFPQAHPPWPQGEGERTILS